MDSDLQFLVALFSMNQTMNCVKCTGLTGNISFMTSIHAVNVPRLFEEKRGDPYFRTSAPRVVGALCAHLLLQVYSDSFETL